MLLRKPRPIFQSDEELIENFEENKSELLSLIQKCEAESDSKGVKRNIRESFIDCDFDESLLAPLDVKEVNIEFKDSARQPISLNDFGGERILFPTDYYIDDRGDTFVEEKGYAYSLTPLRQDVIEGSLD